MPTGVSSSPRQVDQFPPTGVSSSPRQGEQFPPTIAAESNSNTEGAHSFCHERVMRARSMSTNTDVSSYGHWLSLIIYIYRFNFQRNNIILIQHPMALSVFEKKV